MWKEENMANITSKEFNLMTSIIISMLEKEYTEEVIKILKEYQNKTVWQLNFKENEKGGSAPFSIIF